MSSRMLALVLGLAALLVVVLLVYLALSSRSVLYDDPEVFQITLAGTGIGSSDGSILSDDEKKSYADKMSELYGTDYTVPTADQVRSYIADTDGQWCQLGWVTGDAWPFCFLAIQSQGKQGDPACCSNGYGGAQSSQGMNPQPALFLYGRKPKKGQLPMCDDADLASGTLCISYWASGPGVDTPKYSLYD